jgi:hypothetical protein
LEVAIKIKGSQGRPRIEWIKAEHPLTAISDKSDVHANHNEAQNAALRPRASAYRRRQNLYAKKVEGLQRAWDVQRLIHNWVKPHWGLGKCVTPSNLQISDVKLRIYQESCLFRYFATLSCE